MSAPGIPGMDRYPELQKKYRRAYRDASNTSKCPKCENRKVIERYREQLRRRRERDKRPGRP